MPPQLSVLERAEPDPAVDRPDTLGRCTDLGSIVLAFRPTFRRVLGERAALEVDARPGLWVLGHEEQLEAVLMDLVLEARDAMVPGGTLRLSVVRVEDPAAPAVLLTATDGGWGSAPLPSSTRSRACLAVTRSIVEGLGGELWCETARGGGILFQVRLPSRPPARTSGPGGDRNGSAERLANVLVVEDHEVLRQVLVRVLTLRGHAVTAVGTVAEALERGRALGSKVDVLLLDRFLPDGDGTELGVALAPSCPAARVVVMTTDPGGLGALEGARVLAKPFDGRQLLEAIAEALAPA